MSQPDVFEGPIVLDLCQGNGHPTMANDRPDPSVAVFGNDYTDLVGVTSLWAASFSPPNPTKKDE